MHDRKTLLNMPIDEKRSWLRSMVNARKAFGMAKPPTSRFEQQTLVQYSNQNVNNLDYNKYYLFYRAVALLLIYI